MDYILLFFFFFIILILVILGLPYNRTSITNIIDKENAQIVRENFKTSSKSDVQNGASTFYDWGKIESCNNNESSPETQDGDYIENKYYIQPVKKTEIIREKPDCNSCDITKMRGIDKYVLKSSVPACPDMSKYALKSMVKSCPDMKNYIKKSEIPPCPQCPDLKDYVLKSQIPSQVKCPECPVCPVCPVCPPSYKKIQDDPRVKQHINKYQKTVNKKLEEKYITKEQCKNISSQAFFDGVDQGNKKGETIGEMKGFEKGWEKYQDKINLSKTQPIEEIRSLTNVIKNLLTTPPQPTPTIPTSPPIQEEYYPTSPPIQEEYNPTTPPIQYNPTTPPMITTPPTEEEKNVMKNEFLITNPYKNPNKNISCDSGIYTFDNNIPKSTSG